MSQVDDRCAVHLPIEKILLSIEATLQPQELILSWQVFNVKGAMIAVTANVST